MKRTVGLLLLCAALPLSAQDDADSSASSRNKKKPKFKTYESVITTEAVSKKGLFTVHRIDDKFYYEIPTAQLGKEMLLVSRIAKTPGIGYGGEEANRSVVTWERRNDKILMRSRSYTNIAADSLPIAQAVANSNLEEIVGAFPIVSFGADSSAVIDVTSTFTTDVPFFGLPQDNRRDYAVSTLDAGRSFIDYIRAFPENIEVEHTLTYKASKAPQNPASQTITVVMHHSMVKLPERKMMPRLRDNRVGFFSTRKIDFGIPSAKAEELAYIVRWRLEPKDTAAFLRGELTEPIKPITYYIDPNTPERWRPWLKNGVEQWNKAFEKAGFKNAIRALMPPTPEEDPEWSPEDARYSVIRYYPSPVRNAYGPNIHDPRTGEILDSDIGWFHNVADLTTRWYFTQAVSDPAAHKLPLPDSIQGKLIAFVAAHEVGHTLGLPHNMGSSFAYPVDSLRSPSFTKKFGTAPSIMDYARFNYVAQPGDGAALMPQVGPYDDFAVRWGYRPILSAKTPEQELDTLNTWSLEQEKNPYLRWGAQQWIVQDPSAQTEDLGNDPVKATEYGLKNLEYLMTYLVDATKTEHEDYTLLREMYDEVLSQWRREMGHVANVPGGVYITEKRSTQQGPVYTPVPKAKQKEAVAFLGKTAFQEPTMFLKEDILQKTRLSGTVQRLMDAQAGLLNTILASDKLGRLMEQQAAMNKDSYTAEELLTDTEEVIFTELKGKAKLDINAFRRNLQRVYVERLGEIVSQEKSAPGASGRGGFMASVNAAIKESDARALARLHLLSLQKTLGNAAAKGATIETKAHLQDLSLRIAELLDND